MTPQFTASEQVYSPAFGIGTISKVVLVAGAVTAVYVYFPQIKRTIEHTINGVYSFLHLTRTNTSVSPSGTRRPSSGPSTSTPARAAHWDDVLNRLEQMKALPHVDNEVAASVRRRLDYKLRAANLRDSLENLNADDLFRLLVETLDSYEDVDMVVAALPREKRLPGIQVTQQFGQSKVNQTLTDAYARRLRTSAEPPFMHDPNLRGELVRQIIPPMRSPDVAANSMYPSAHTPEAIKTSRLPAMPRSSSGASTWAELAQMIMDAGDNAPGKPMLALAHRIKLIQHQLPRLADIRSSDDMYRILANLTGDFTIAGTTKADRELIRVNQYLPERLKMAKDAQRSAVVPLARRGTHDTNVLSKFERYRTEPLPAQLAQIPELAQYRQQWIDAIGERAAYHRLLQNDTAIDEIAEGVMWRLLNRSIAMPGDPINTAVLTDRINYPVRGGRASIDAPLFDIGAQSIYDQPLNKSALEFELQKGMASIDVKDLMNEQGMLADQLGAALRNLDLSAPDAPLISARLAVQRQIAFRTQAHLNTWRRSLHTQTIVEEANEQELQDEFIEEHNLTKLVEAHEANQDFYNELYANDTGRREVGDLVTMNEVRSTAKNAYMRRAVLGLESYGAGVDAYMASAIRMAQYAGPDRLAYMDRELLKLQELAARQTNANQTFLARKFTVIQKQAQLIRKSGGKWRTSWWQAVAELGQDSTYGMGFSPDMTPLQARHAVMTMRREHTDAVLNWRETNGMKLSLPGVEAQVVPLASVRPAPELAESIIALRGNRLATLNDEMVNNAKMFMQYHAGQRASIDALNQPWITAHTKALSGYERDIATLLKRRSTMSEYDFALALHNAVVPYTVSLHNLRTSLSDLMLTPDDELYDAVDVFTRRSGMAHQKEALLHSNLTAFRENISFGIDDVLDYFSYSAGDAHTRLANDINARLALPINLAGGQMTFEQLLYPGVDYHGNLVLPHLAKSGKVISAGKNDAVLSRFAGAILDNEDIAGEIHSYYAAALQDVVLGISYAKTTPTITVDGARINATGTAVVEEALRRTQANLGTIRTRTGYVTDTPESAITPLDRTRAYEQAYLEEHALIPQSYARSLDALRSSDPLAYIHCDPTAEIRKIHSGELAALHLGEVPGSLGLADLALFYSQYHIATGNAIPSSMTGITLGGGRYAWVAPNAQRAVTGTLGDIRVQYAQLLAGQMILGRMMTDEEFSAFAGEYGVTVENGRAANTWDAIRDALYVGHVQSVEDASRSAGAMASWQRNELLMLRRLRGLTTTIGAADRSALVRLAHPVLNDPHILTLAEKYLPTSRDANQPHIGLEDVDPHGDFIRDDTSMRDFDRALDNANGFVDNEGNGMHITHPVIPGASFEADQLTLRLLAQHHTVADGHGWIGTTEDGSTYRISNLDYVNGQVVVTGRTAGGQAVSLAPGGAIEVRADNADDLKVLTRATDAIVHGQPPSIGTMEPMAQIRVRGGQFISAGYGSLDTSAARSLVAGDNVSGFDIETFGRQKTPYLVEFGHGTIGASGAAEDIASTVYGVRVSSETAAAMRQILQAGPVAGDKTYQLLQSGLQGIHQNQAYPYRSSWDPMAVVDYLETAAPTMNEVFAQQRPALANAVAIAGYNTRQFDIPALAASGLDQHHVNLLQDKALDVFAALHDLTGANISLQSLLPRTETHGGGDIVDTLQEGLAAVRRLDGVTPANERDAQYFVSKRTGTIYTHSGTTRELLEGGAVRYTSVFNQLLGGRGIAVTSEGATGHAMALNSVFTEAGTLDEAQELHEWKLDDLASRRVRRHEARYLDQDRQIIEQYRNFRNAGIDPIEGLTDYRKQLLDVPVLLQQRESAATRAVTIMEELKAAQAKFESGNDAAVQRVADLIAEYSDVSSVEARLSMLGLSQMSATRAGRRAERLLEATGRIISGLQTRLYDDNVLSEQFARLSSGVFSGNNVAGNAIQNLAETVDESVANGTLAQSHGQLVMQTVWRDLYSHGLVSQVQHAGSDRSRFEMRGSIPLASTELDGGLELTARNLSFDLTSPESMRTSFQYTLSRIHKEMINTHGVVPDPESIRTAVEGGMRSALRLDQDLTGEDLLAQAREKLINLPLTYYDTDSLGSGGREGEAADLVNWWTHTVANDPERAIRQALPYQQAPNSVPAHLAHEYGYDPDEYVHSNIEEGVDVDWSAPRTVAVTVPDLIQRTLPLEFNLSTAPLSLEKDIAVTLGEAARNLPSLAARGGLAGLIGAAVIGTALAFHNPLSGGAPQPQEQSQYSAEHTLTAPNIREALVPAEQPTDGQGPQHLSVTIRGVTGASGEHGHLAELVQRVLATHSGVDYQSTVSATDNRRGMNRGWIKDVQKRVY